MEQILWYLVYGLRNQDLDLMERIVHHPEIMDIELHAVTEWGIWISPLKRAEVCTLCGKKGSCGYLLVRKADCGRDH